MGSQGSPSLVDLCSNSSIPVPFELTDEVCNAGYSSGCESQSSTPTRSRSFHSCSSFGSLGFCKPKSTSSTCDESSTTIKLSSSRNSSSKSSSTIIDVCRKRLESKRCSTPEKRDDWSHDCSGDDYEFHCAAQPVKRTPSIGKINNKTKGCEQRLPWNYGAAGKQKKTPIQLKTAEKKKPIIQVTKPIRIPVPPVMNHKQKTNGSNTPFKPLPGIKKDYSKIRSKVDTSCPKSFCPRPTSMCFMKK